MITADEIVQAVSDGVKRALETCEFFLGIEESEFQNAQIHPEYVTTVKVGEALAAPDRVVALEVLMRKLKRDALWLARRATLNNSAAWAVQQQKISAYSFGKKRLDIMVRTSGPDSAPLLFAEAKLGAGNLAGIIEDIDRVLTLLAMYDDLGLAKNTPLYGAVVFHVMKEGVSVDSLKASTTNLFRDVNSCLVDWKSKRPWLQYKAGLLTRAHITQPVSGYEEQYNDGTTEPVFAKESFAFAPGLVIVGCDPTIHDVKF